MRNQVKRLSAVAAILLALVAGACSESNPVQPLAPSDESSESLSLADDLRAIASGRPIDRAWHAEQVIGPEGGFIYVDLHHLYVPRGAVSGPTKFTIDLSQSIVGAELTATSVDSRGRPTGRTNNVGSRGFKVPVYLTFSYNHAYDVPLNPFKIKVVEIRDGKLIPQATQVNPLFETATGVLSHFSDYGLAWPTRNTR